jgi:hypothetical protein
MNQTKLEKEVRFLKLYAAFTTLAFGSLSLLGFSSHQGRPKFEEIDVERINVVEKDGRLRMVISNEARQHPGIINGKTIQRSGPRPPGIIFFNHLGDEMGGLIFGDNGGKGHFGSFTWDKVRNDQTIRIGHLESDNGSYQSGIELWQRPDIPGDITNAEYDAANKIVDSTARKAAIQALIDSGRLGTGRMFLGKRRDNSVALAMADMKGKTRIRLQVKPDGTPSLEFLDDSAKVIYSLPASR